MHPVIAKTFGGLSKPYYFRQLFFGLLLFSGAIFMLSRKHDVPLEMFLLTAINTLLYPYARFAYESVVGLIMGRNVFFVNALLMMFVKLTTMMFCWICAIFIAPVGLAYLYYHHSNGS